MRESVRKSKIAMLQERERQGKAGKGPDHDRARERMIERTSKRENERARKGEGKQRKSQGGRTRPYTRLLLSRAVGQGQ